MPTIPASAAGAIGGPDPAGDRRRAGSKTERRRPDHARSYRSRQRLAAQSGDSRGLRRGSAVSKPCPLTRGVLAIRNDRGRADSIDCDPGPARVGQAHDRGIDERQAGANRKGPAKKNPSLRPSRPASGMASAKAKAAAAHRRKADLREAASATAAPSAESPAARICSRKDSAPSAGQPGTTRSSWSVEIAIRRIRRSDQKPVRAPPREVGMAMR